MTARPCLRLYWNREDGSVGWESHTLCRLCRTRRAEPRDESRMARNSHSAWASHQPSVTLLGTSTTWYPSHSAAETCRQHTPAPSVLWCGADSDSLNVLGRLGLPGVHSIALCKMGALSVCYWSRAARDRAAR